MSRHTSKLEFRRDGIYDHYYTMPEYDEDDERIEEDDEKGGMEKIDLSDPDCLAHLRNMCEVEKGLTLRDFMSVVRGSKPLCDLISRYSWASVDSWNAVLDDAPVAPSDCVEYLKVGVFGEHGQYGHMKDLPPLFDGDDTDYSDMEDDFSISVDFCGIGEYSEEDKKNFKVEPGDKCNYGFGEDIRDVLDKELRVDHHIIVYRLGEKHEELFRARYAISLMELLDAIYWEISFYGPPQNREEFFEELNDRKKEIDEAIERGEEPGIPWEEVKEKLRSNITESMQKRFNDQLKERNIKILMKLDGTIRAECSDEVREKYPVFIRGIEEGKFKDYIK